VYMMVYLGKDVKRVTGAVKGTPATVAGQDLILGLKM
jgi:hypothetical protein